MSRPPRPPPSPPPKSSLGMFASFFALVAIVVALIALLPVVVGGDVDVDAKGSVSVAIKGLDKKTRFARGLQNQCVDAFDSLEQRARKAGTDFLHNHVNNWHHVKNQDRRFDLLSKAVTDQENEFSKKYETDIPRLSENLQLLEPVKAKKKEILAYQTELTTKILSLNDLASKVAREKFHAEIKFLAKTNVPCLKAIMSHWETTYEELKEVEDGETKIELKEENESKEEVAKKAVEAALRVYEEKIQQFFKLAHDIAELRIKLKDAGFNADGSMNEEEKMI